MTSIFGYISLLFGEELLTFDDWLTELPGLLHQSNLAISSLASPHLYMRLHIEKYITATVIWLPPSPTLHASVYVITSISARYIIQFINSLAHVDQVPLNSVFTMQISQGGHYL